MANIKKNRDGQTPASKQPTNSASPPAPLALDVDQSAPQGAMVASFEASVTSYSGPLPPPAVLRQFEEILPGSAERIFAQFERQSEHRRSLEASVVANEITQSKRGTFAAFALGMTGLVIAAYFAYLGHPVSGATVGGVGLASLLTAFLTGVSSRRRERKDKAKEMARAINSSKPESTKVPASTKD